MFKVSYNRAILGIRVETVTPLSIRAGDGGLDPTSSDLACVRTHHRIHGTTVYIPGSSFKGVIRSTAEAQLRLGRFRHLGGETLEGACDPADHRNSCARHKDGDTTAVHRANCAACRVFGSLTMRGRCAPRDLFPFKDATTLAEHEVDNLTRANKVEVRHGVLIGRMSGSVDGGALFDQEMVPAGVHFHGEIVLQNYQTWQLGLLCAAIDELTQGFAQLGSSKTRGLGVVRVEIDSLLHEQTSRSEDRPMGVGELVDEGTRRAYGLFDETRLPKATGSIHGLSRRFAATEPGAITRWRNAGLQALADLSARDVRGN
jgi:CRISPR-associated protein Csm3